MPVLYLIIFGCFAILFIYLSISTSIIRDEIIDHDAFCEYAKTHNISKVKAPFSLARTQIAFWTVIIMSSFVYVLIHYNDVPELNTANLLLLGISLGTIATAKIIDDSQRDFERHQDEPSEGFIKDIISDNKGVSIHRLQNVLWTLVLGCIYIHYVSTNNSLPDETVLTDQLLTLTGISTAAYIGLKATENKQTKAKIITKPPSI